MATFSMQAASVFPVGTVVKVYPQSALVQAGQEPSGTLVAQSTVASDGSLAFTGLTDETRYVASAQVSGAWRTIKFTTDPAPVGFDIDTVIGLEGILDLKADLVGGEVPDSQLPDIEQADVQDAVEGALAASTVLQDAATDALADVVAGLELMPAVTTELDDPVVSFVAGATDERSWLEIAADGGPTEHSADLIVAKANLTPAVELDGEPDVAFGFVDENDRRTDLEVNEDGQFTDRVIESVGDRTRLPAMYPLATSTPMGIENMVPAFRKLPNPVLNATVEFGTGSKMWLTVVDVRGKIADPIDNFYGLYSPDHSTDNGGLFLVTAPKPEGPFTLYRTAAVYADTVEGDSTETPWIVWNNETQLFHVYYQNRFAGFEQSTLLATTATFLPGSYTRVGIVMDVANLTDQPGNGHTGYARVQRLAPNTWVAYSTKGGAGVSLTGLWYSDDGIEWEADPRSLTPHVDKMGSGIVGMGVLPMHVNWYGVDWCIHGIAPTGQGGVEDYPGQFNSAIGISRWYGLRRPMGPATVILEYEGEPGMDDTHAVCWLLPSEGKLYLYFKSGDDTFVAVANGLEEAHVPAIPLTGNTSLKEEVVTRRVPAGKTTALIDVDFGFAEAFPTLPGGDPALEVVYTGGSGTTSFEAIQNGGSGHLAVTLVAGSGKTASLQAPFDVDLSLFEEAEVTVEGYYSGPNSSITMHLGFVGATNGAFVRAASANAPVVRCGTGTPIDVGDFSNMILNKQLEYGRKRNLTFLLRTRTKRAYLCMDDQVGGFAEVPDMTLGLARPAFQLISNDGAAHVFRVTRWALTLRRN